MTAKKGRTASTDSVETDARLARRKRRRDRTRGDILGAARKVLLQSGLAAMTLDAVAKEAGMSKTGLYYYFPSKDALVFDLVFGIIEGQASAVHDAVEKASDGREALRAIIRETVHTFAPRLDDFRLAFLFGQVAGAGAVRLNAEQLSRIRPLNDLCLAGAARMLRKERSKRAGRPGVEPRLLAFLAYLAAIGLLTMKGLAQQLDDPLAFSDEQLIQGLGKVFAAAATA